MKPVHVIAAAAESERPGLNRRRFLAGAAAAVGVPLILPRGLWGQGNAPSSRLALGVIGIGQMGTVLLRALVGRADVEVVAVCDVDTTRREAARRRVEEARSAQTGQTHRACAAYNDFRELLARADIDAVVIATPDHWHAFMGIAAVQAGKDVYCEKPLTHNVHESVQLVRAVRRSGRVLQTGSQQRSSREFRVAAEIVRNGCLGRISAVHVHFGDPASHYRGEAEALEPGLDWDLWCGPGPLVPYNSQLSPRGVHTHYPPWRATWEFGGGAVTNWGAHHIDIAHWALGFDGSGPVAVHAPERWQEAKHGARLVYPDGTVIMHVQGGEGVSFFGSAGELRVYRGKFELRLGGKVVRRFWDRAVDKGTSAAREVEFAARDLLSDAKIRLEESGDHFQNFVDCVRTRRRPICDVEIGAGTVNACHVMNFAYRHGANVKWDPARQTFAEGGETRWLTRDHYRAGWTV
jgi:predicted dehydrogenase